MPDYPDLWTDKEIKTFTGKLSSDILDNRSMPKSLPMKVQIEMMDEARVFVGKVSSILHEHRRKMYDKKIR